MRAQAQRRWRIGDPLAPSDGRRYLEAPRKRASRLLTRARSRVAASRSALPLLGTLGVALGIPAALLTDRWWMLAPMAGFAWWFAPRDWGWEWLTAVLVGVVGTEWAAVGAFSLAAWPSQRLLISALWAGAAATLAVVAAAQHRAQGRKG